MYGTALIDNAYIKKMLFCLIVKYIVLTFSITFIKSILRNFSIYKIIKI
jgi:hypothetical protein